MAANQSNPLAKLAIGIASVTAVAALAGTLGASTQKNAPQGDVATQDGLAPSQFQFQQGQQFGFDDDENEHAAPQGQVEGGTDSGTTTQRQRTFRNQQSGQAGQSGQTGVLPRTRSRHS